MKKNKLQKKDYIIILVLTIIYAITAFINLGDTKAPCTKPDLNTEGGALAVLTEETNIKLVSYYKGLGDTEIKIISSNDGKTWQDEVIFESGDTFKWEQVEVDISDTHFIGVTAADKNAEIFEMAFYDENGNRADIKSKSKMFDEQEMASPFATYKNGMYFDEIYHARTAYEHNHNIGSHYENTHPPLGKLIIGIGIRIFGMNPFGWRFMGTLFGILMIPVMFLLTFKVFENRFLAFSGACLICFDFMHFAQTRIATIDSFAVLFIMLMYYFMYIFYKEQEDMTLKKSMIILLLCGVCSGLGIASKWISAYALLGIAVLFLCALIKKKKSMTDGFSKWLIIMLLWGVAVFAVIPFLIYYASYIPINIADKSTNWFADFLNYQKHMLGYHVNLKEGHPYASPWYEWPAMIRPIWYYKGKNVALGNVSSIVSFGNPLIWWGGAVSILYLVLSMIKKNDKQQTAFILIGFLSQYLPWIFISRAVFIYHFFASVPFLVLALVYVFKVIIEKYTWGKAFAISYIVLSGILFLMFYPVLSGMEVNRIYVKNVLSWFKSWNFCN